SGVLLSFRKLFGDAEPDLPRDVSGRPIDRRQTTPWRFLTGPIRIGDAHIEAATAATGAFVVGNRRSVFGLLHPAKRADVLRDYKDVSGAGIGRDAAPVCAAEPSREQQRARW